MTVPKKRFDDPLNASYCKIASNINTSLFDQDLWRSDNNNDKLILKTALHV